MVHRRTNLTTRLFFFFWWTWPVIHSLQVYSIGNVSLIAVSRINITTLVNTTCDQCLCSAFRSNAVAFNCFLGNSTCQLFGHFPRTYRLQPTSAVRLYFPQGVLPNASASCMPNLNQLISQLSNATVTSVNISTPRCLVIDNHGYLVTVEDRGNVIKRLNPLTLTLIDITNLNGSPTMNIAYHRQAFYISYENGTILIIDSNDLSTINTITGPQISAPRDMIFLHDGQTMIIASVGNNNLLFFNCTNYATRNYIFAYSISTGYSAPHGLWYVNDLFFYATSWSQNTICSYSTNDSVSWTETLIADVRPVLNGSAGGGSHVSLDEDGRIWFSLYQSGVAIIDAQGTFLYNYDLISNGLFDLLFLDNYTMYLSDVIAGRILRLSPNITC